MLLWKYLISMILASYVLASDQLESSSGQVELTATRSRDFTDIKTSFSLSRRSDRQNAVSPSTSTMSVVSTPLPNSLVQHSESKVGSITNSPKVTPQTILTDAATASAPPSSISIDKTSSQSNSEHSRLTSNERSSVHLESSSSTSLSLRSTFLKITITDSKPTSAASSQTQQSWALSSSITSSRGMFTSEGWRHVTNTATTLTSATSHEQSPYIETSNSSTLTPIQSTLLSSALISIETRGSSTSRIKITSSSCCSRSATHDLTMTSFTSLIASDKQEESSRVWSESSSPLSGSKSRVSTSEGSSQIKKSTTQSITTTTYRSPLSIPTTGHTSIITGFTSANPTTQTPQVPPPEPTIEVIQPPTTTHEINVGSTSDIRPTEVLSSPRHQTIGDSTAAGYSTTTHPWHSPITEYSTTTRDSTTPWHSTTRDFTTTTPSTNSGDFTITWPSTTTGISHVQQSEGIQSSILSPLSSNTLSQTSGASQSPISLTTATVQTSSDYPTRTTQHVVVVTEVRTTNVAVPSTNTLAHGTPSIHSDVTLTSTRKVIVVDGETLTANSESGFVIGSQTLFPGSAVTQNNTIITLPRPFESENALKIAIGSAAYQTLTRGGVVTAANRDVLSLSPNGELVIVQPKDGTTTSPSAYVPQLVDLGGQVLTPGGKITVGSNILSLAADRSGIEVIGSATAKAKPSSIGAREQVALWWLSVALAMSAVALR